MFAICQWFWRKNLMILWELLGIWHFPPPHHTKNPRDRGSRSRASQAASRGSRLGLGPSRCNFAPSDVNFRGNTVCSEKIKIHGQSIGAVATLTCDGFPKAQNWIFPWWSDTSRLIQGNPLEFLSGVTFGKQTWRAGKSPIRPIQFNDFPIETSIHSKCSH